MRDIKFRAWEKALEEMIPVDRIDFKNQIINTDGPWRFFKEVELTQYTGFKDKNGVEIYEGDIIRIDKFFSGVEIIAQIYYKNTGFALLTTRESDTTEGYFYIVIPISTVIGNIYENPELLEVSTE